MLRSTITDDHLLQFIDHPTRTCVHLLQYTAKRLTSLTSPTFVVDHSHIISKCDYFFVLTPNKLDTYISFKLQRRI